MKVNLKIRGQFEEIQRCLEQLGKDYSSVLASRIIENERDNDFHCLVDVDLESWIQSSKKVLHNE